MKTCASMSHVARADSFCGASTTEISTLAPVEMRTVSASAVPPAEDQASIAVTPSVVDAAKFNSSDGLGSHEPTRSLPLAGSHATVSQRSQPHDAETVAAISKLACSPSETAATAIPGSACAVAALLDLDAHIDMNMMTLRVAAMSSTTERSASS